MLKRTADLYVSIDFLGSKIEPSFNSEKQIKSCFGATLSLVLGILGLLGFGFFGIEMISKKNVRSTESTISVEESVLPLSELPVLIYMHSRGVQLNLNLQFRRAVKFRAELKVSVPDEQNNLKMETRQIPVISCASVQLNEKAEAVLIERKFDKRGFLCLDLNALKTPEEEKSLRNNAGTIGSRYLEVIITKCDKKLDPNCDDFLEKSLPNFSISAMLPDYQLDISNFNSPLTYLLKSTSALINKDFNSGKLIAMENNQLQSDVGWLFNSVENTNYFIQGSERYTFAPYNELDKELYKLMIDAPNVLKKYSRSYVKLQEVIANVGGFMKALMMIASFINKGYSDYIFLKRIEAVFEPAELNLKAKNIKKPIINNMVLANQKESVDDLKIAEVKFKTGVGVTTMNMMEVSAYSYLKYVFRNCCRKKKDVELEEYWKYIDFKHTFSEIIRIKEQIAEQDLRQN